MLNQLKSRIAWLKAKRQLKGHTLKALLQKLQAFAKADKAVVISVAISAAVALASSFGYHLKGEAVAVISMIVNLGLGYFLQQNFKAKLAAKKDA